MDTICLPAIAAFRATHPRIRVRLETLPWPAALAQLRARLCDLAVVTAGATFDGDAFAVEPLPKQRLVFAVAPGHPLAALRRPGVGRVLGYPLVTTAHLSVRLHKALAEARGEAGGRRADLPCPAVQVESPPAWISLAAAGGHVALTSLAAASGAIARGEVVVLPVEAPWLATEPAIVQLAERPLSQSARDFGAALRAANAASVATAEAMWTALTQGRAAP
jgi:DNA-binding transcriptional LysR family regulator